MDNFRTIPTVDILRNELKLLVKLGFPDVRIESFPALFSLRAVGEEIRGETLTDSVLALEHALRRAISLLGPGDRADATRALFGLDPATRSIRRPRRREAAKDILLGPAWDLQTFRRRYEQPLVGDAAYALYKLESMCVLVFPSRRTRSTRSKPPADHPSGNPRLLTRLYE